jgi:hypothetical protein
MPSQGRESGLDILRESELAAAFERRGGLPVKGEETADSKTTGSSTYYE